MNRIAKRSMISLLLCFALLLGLAAFLWEYGTSAYGWVTFPGSPHLYNGLGKVTDSAGNLLLNLENGRTYQRNALLRMATVHYLGDRNGSVSAPALSYHASEEVSFTLLNGIYTYGASYGDAQLTLNSEMQLSALQALGDKRGTVAVYNYETGALLCSVTTPTFDPDAPIEEKDSMYLNRFTQGLYTPGSIFKLVTLAAALEEDPAVTGQLFTCTGEIVYNETDKITCERIHGTQTLEAAFRNSCNCAFARLAEMLGKEKLSFYAQKFGVTEKISFDGITVTQGRFDLTDAYGVNVAWSAVGQYTGMVNPCAFLTFVGAVARGGQGVNPYVVSRISAGQKNIYTAQTAQRQRIVSEETARILTSYLRGNVSQKYGDEHFPGLSVCAKTGTAEVGENQKPNAMLTGFVKNAPLAFIVCVEDGGYGSQVCIPIIAKVLAAYTG